MEMSDKMVKWKWKIIRGVAVLAVFIVLLSLRLGFFNHSPQGYVPALPDPAIRPAETWMNVYQNRHKIGLVHRKFRQFENGYFQTEETISISIKTMGISQTLHIVTETDLKPDMSLSSFQFELNSGPFSFTARGFVAGDSIIIYSRTPHAESKTVLPVKEIPHLSGNIYEAAFRENMDVDQFRQLSILDPSSFSARKISVWRHPDEVIIIMGRPVMTHKFCGDFMGANHCAWLSKDGEILKETGLMGLSMEKVSFTEAQKGNLADPLTDWSQIASIPSNVIIADPSRLKQIRVRIEGKEQAFLNLAGGRQSFQANILTVTSENVHLPSERFSPSDEEKQKFLQATPLAPSDHPEIMAQAMQIVSASDSPQEKTRKIVAWVYKNITKIPVVSIPNALEVLRLKQGDCNEHAVLTAALLRAAGVPAQIETGLVYLNGRFYYHAWNSAFTDRWMTADAVFNQIPADETHIRLAGGEHGSELDLLGVVGRIKLEVLSTSYD